MNDTSSTTNLPQNFPEVTIDANGKANVTIPIELPPGIIQPELALVYHSDSGDGILGVGWQLSGLHFISRDPSFGVRYDGNDHYISSLDGSLVPTSEDGLQFKPKNDPFTTYQANTGSCGTSPSICSWTVIKQDGTQYTFASKIKAIGTSNSEDVRVWALSQVTDLNGNSYIITYTSDSGAYYPYQLTYANGKRTVSFVYSNKTSPYPTYTDGKEQINQLLTSIKVGYTNTDNSSGTIETYTLGYNESGSYPSSLFPKSDFLTSVSRANYKKVGIAYFSAGSWKNSGDKSLSGFATTYKVKAPVDGQTRSSVCEPGRLACLCSASATCLSVSPQAQGVCALYTSNGDAEKCENGSGHVMFQLFPADINGDGKMEFFKLTGDESNKDIRLTYQKVGNDIGSDEAKLSTPYSIVYNSYLAMGDINGDGKSDFVYTTIRQIPQGTGKYYHVINVAFANSNGSGFDGGNDMDISADIPKLDFKKALESQTTKSQHWLADVDGDGRMDFVQKVERTRQGVYTGEWAVETYLSRGTGLGNSAKQPNFYFDVPYPLKDLDNDSYLDYADEFTQVVDVNGDGKAEYVNIKKDTNTLEIQSLTDGTTLYTLELPDKRENRVGNTWLADVNGDGKQDFVYLSSSNTLKVYFFTGNGFSSSPVETALENGAYVTVNNFDSMDDNAKKEAQRKNRTNLKTFGDVNGDGKADFVYNKDNTDGTLFVVCSDGQKFEVGNGCNLTLDDNTMTGSSVYMVMDIDGDGKGDVIGTKGVYDNDGNTTDSGSIASYRFGSSYIGLLSSLTGGRNHKVDVTYTLGPKPDGTESRNYPDLPNSSPNYVATQVTVYHNNAEVGKSVYTYSGERVLSGNMENRRNLGFETITKKTYFGSKEASKDIDTYFQDSDLAGNIKEKKHYVYDSLDAEKLTTMQISMYEKVTLNGAEWVRPTSGTQVSYTENQTSGLTTATTTNTYDTNGNVIKKETKTSPGNYVDTIESSDFNDFGKPGTITKKSGDEIIEKMVLEFINGTNNVQTEKKLESGTETYTTVNYTYYSNGTVKTETDPNGNETEYTYDSDVGKFITNIKKQANGKTFTITKEYDTLTGNIKSEKDIHELTTYKDYDSYGRTIKIWYAGNSKGDGNYNEEYVYVDTDTEKSVTRILKDGTSSGLWYKEYTDDWGRVYKKESKARSGSLLEGELSDIVITEDFEFVDNRQLVKQNSIPYYDVKDRKWTTYEYDFLDRPTKVTYPDGTSKTFAYTGFKTEITSPTGTKTININAKQMVLNQEELGIKTYFEYYPSGKMKSAYTSAGDSTSMTYDMQGRKLTQKSPNSGTVTTTYYPNGQVKSQKDARGKTITYQYDGMNRITEIERPDNEAKIVNTYDESMPGKLSKVQDESGTTEIFYNTKGQMSAKKMSIDDYSFIFRYGYDSLGRLNQITYPSGVVIHKIYSESGHLQEIQMDDAKGENKGNRVVSYGVTDTENHQVERLSGNNVRIGRRFGRTTYNG
ncbi:MAG: hypothetical protein KDK90_26615 [Leptospiraceae bacterium]|nr:hypothetical protein [Leptospiraceae bacterium]